MSVYYVMEGNNVVRGPYYDEDVAERERIYAERKYAKEFEVKEVRQKHEERN